MESPLVLPPILQPPISTEIKKLSPRLTGLYLSVPALLFEAVPEKYQHRYTSHVECGDAPIMDTEDLGLLMLGMLPLAMRHPSLWLLPDVWFKSYPSPFPYHRGESGSPVPKHTLVKFRAWYWAIFKSRFETRLPTARFSRHSSTLVVTKIRRPIAGLDAMRDGAIIYEKILREEYGIRTRVDLYQGIAWLHGTIKVE